MNAKYFYFLTLLLSLRNCITTRESILVSEGFSNLFNDVMNLQSYLFTLKSKLSTELSNLREKITESENQILNEQALKKFDEKLQTFKNSKSNPIENNNQLDEEIQKFEFNKEYISKFILNEFNQATFCREIFKSKIQYLIKNIMDIFENLQEYQNKINGLSVIIKNKEDSINEGSENNQFKQKNFSKTNDSENDSNSKLDSRENAIQPNTSEDYDVISKNNFQSQNENSLSSQTESIGNENDLSMMNVNHNEWVIVKKKGNSNLKTSENESVLVNFLKPVFGHISYLFDLSSFVL